DKILYNYQEKIIPQERGINTLIGDNTVIRTSMNTILDLINNGVIETDSSGFIIGINNKAEAILNIGAKEIVGKNINVIFDIDTTNEIDNLFVNYKKENLIVNLKHIKIFSNKVGNIITIE